MKIKKILSLVMAFAMVLSLAATALAEDDTGDTLTGTAPSDSADLEHHTRYLGETEVPLVKLSISSLNHTLAFNPYKLAVGLDSSGIPLPHDSTDTPTSTMNDQLITKEITITNKTNVPMKLKGSFTVTPYRPTDATVVENDALATLSNKTIAATETTKKIYAYADFYPYDGAVFKDIPETTKTACAGYRLTAATAGTAVAHQDKAPVVMQATDGTNANYVYVKVSGEATPSPTLAWKDYDMVQIDLVFTFQTQPNFEKYSVINVAADSGSLEIGNYNVNPTYTAIATGVEQAPGTDTEDLAKGKTGNTVAGYTCYVAPATGYQITNVKFYDKTGKTAITTVKATSTNTKDKTAPWTFTMPADNVFIQVLGDTVPST